MDRQELKTSAVTAIETANRAMTKASILGGRVMRAATQTRLRVGERFPRLGLAPERSRTQEAIHSPAFWAFGGSLAAGAVTAIKPIREQIVTTAKQAKQQASSKITEYIGGKPQDSQALQRAGLPPAPGTQPTTPTMRREADELMGPAQPTGAETQSPPTI